MKSIKKGCNGALAVLFVAVLVVLAGGCQTTVPVSYTQPARFDMSGINKVGIISNNSDIEQAVASALSKTGKYSVAGAGEMNELLPWLRQQELLSNGLEMTAASLAGEYDANEVRADQKYDARIIKVTGTVTEFQKGAVRLGVGNNSVDLYINKAEIDKVAELNKGDTITVVGKNFGLKPPYEDGINEILAILGGAGKHVNIADASFFIPEYTGAVDAVFKVEETHSENIESQTKPKPATTEDGETLKDAEGKTIYKDVAEYRKVVNVSISYSLINAKDGATIGSGSTSAEARTGYNEDVTKLTVTSTLVSQSLKEPVKTITGDIVPTQQNLAIKLAKSDTQDKDLKAALNEANKLVKAKDYAGAADAYGKIYADTNDWSAGYNQAVLTEAAVSTEQAVALMEALAKVSDKPEVQSMLTEMQRRNAANKRAAAQMAD